MKTNTIHINEILKEWLILFLILKKLVLSLLKKNIFVTLLIDQLFYLLYKAPQVLPPWAPRVCRNASESL